MEGWFGNGHTCCLYALDSPLWGRNFPAAVPNLDGLTYIYQLPHVQKQLIFSFCLPHLLCMLLPGSYLLLAQPQNIPLATWANSHALLWTTQAPTYSWQPCFSLETCRANSPVLSSYLTHLWGYSVFTSSKLLPYTFKLELQLLTCDI